MMNESTIVIGSGPAGASASIYLAEFLHPVILIDRNNGYKRTKMAMGIENFLGHQNPIKGPKLLEKIDKQLKKFPVQRINDEVIETNLKKDGSFIVKTGKGKKLSAKYLVIAVGLKDGTINLPEVADYYDNGIFHCMTCNWFKNRNKKIAAVGNTDGAILTALDMNALHRPPKLVVVPTEKKPKFSKSMLKKTKQKKIEVYFSPLAKILGKNNFIGAIELENGKKIKIDVLFTSLGMERADYFLDKGGIKPKRDKLGFIKVNFRTFESSIKNLFAVGPCNNGPDQVIIAGGQGAMAALEIHKIILEKLN